MKEFQIISCIMMIFGPVDATVGGLLEVGAAEGLSEQISGIRAEALLEILPSRTQSSGNEK